MLCIFSLKGVSSLWKGQTCKFAETLPLLPRVTAHVVIHRALDGPGFAFTAGNLSEFLVSHLLASDTSSPGVPGTAVPCRYARFAGERL